MVVLLTLLAVLGSAFLITSRLAADQVTPGNRDARPTQGEPDTFEVNLREVERAAQMQLVLDLMGRDSAIAATELPANVTAGTPIPSGRRDLAATPSLLWRPTESQQSGALTGTPADIFDPLFPWHQDSYGTVAVAGALASGTTTPTFPYLDIDAPGGTDPHLAEAKPHREDRGNMDPTDDVVFWPWISGPLEGLPGFAIDPVFVDPFGLVTNRGVEIDDANGDVEGPGLVAFFDQPGSNPTNPGSLIEWLDFSRAGAGANRPYRRRANLTPGLYLNGTGYEYSAPSPPRGVFGAAGGEFYNDRNRQFLGLFLDGDEDGDGVVDSVPNGQQNGNEQAFFAADADGDGVADSGLVPILPKPTSSDNFFDNAIVRNVGDPERYRHRDGYFYFYAVRIVDNSALPNIDTAMSRTNDFWGSPTAPYGTDQAFAYLNSPAAGASPNFGIFPSNVGLRSLFPINGDRPGALDMPVGYDGQDEFNVLATRRAGGIAERNLPGVRRVDIDRATINGRTDITFATFGEAFGIGHAQRLYREADLFPSGNDVATNINPAPDAAFAEVAGTAVAADLAFNGGGFLRQRPQSQWSSLDRTLPGSMVVQAGNFVPQSQYIWTKFPLGSAAADLDASQTARRSLWYDQFHNVDPDARTYSVFSELITGTGTGTASIDNFPRSPRGLVTGTGGVGQAVSAFTDTAGVGPYDIGATLPDGMPAYRDDATTLPMFTALGAVVGANPVAGDLAAVPPVKASLNTDYFAVLWRAFWNVMVDEATGEAPGADVDAPGADLVNQTAFVNPFLPARPVTPVGWSREITRTLRAAIAAVNVMDIRDVERVAVAAADPSELGDADVTFARINLDEATITPAPPVDTDLRAHVFGTEAQPFVTEAVVVVDPGVKAATPPALPPLYVGVELYNPYPFAINTEGWKLVAVDTSGVALAFFELADLPVTIGANSVVVLEGDNGGGNPGITVSGGVGGTAITVADVVDGTTLRQIMLMRPVLSEGNPAQAAIAASLNVELGDENSEAWQYMVPLDSVDFSEVDTTIDPETVYHYGRSTTLAQRTWDYVYHGDLPGGLTDAPPAPVAPPTPSTPPASVIVQMDLLDPIASGVDPTIDSINLGDIAGYDTIVDDKFPIPLGPVISGPGARASLDPTARSFYPYGGFARDGDVINVPYVGGYHIIDLDPAISTGATTGIVGSMPVTIDAVKANENELDDDAHIGRFIGSDAAGADVVDKVWARKTIDYFAALVAPGSDQFPMVDLRYRFNDPTLTVDPAATLPAGIPAAIYEFESNLLTPPPLPTPEFESIGADPYSTDAFGEAFAGLPGRINLSTASIGAIELIPNVVVGTGQAPAASQAGVAAGLFDPLAGSDGVAEYLTGTAGTREPFVGTTAEASSDAFDLVTFAGTTTTIDQALAGDLSGRLDAGSTDPEDFNDYGLEYYDYDGSIGALAPVGADYADLIRRSNLTTRQSDSYTVYIVLQAWADVDAAGGKEPRLVRQERSAFILDRSRLRPFTTDAGGAVLEWSDPVGSPGNTAAELLQGGLTDTNAGGDLVLSNDAAALRAFQDVLLRDVKIERVPVAD